MQERLGIQCYECSLNRQCVHHIVSIHSCRGLAEIDGVARLDLKDEGIDLDDIPEGNTDLVLFTMDLVGLMSLKIPITLQL